MPTLIGSTRCGQSEGGENHRLPTSVLQRADEVIE
jgi:hypothetical protein